MTDIILAAGRQISRDLSKAPRQEWLGPASPRHGPADQGDAGGPTSIRLVGHKVLAGAGRASMAPSVNAASRAVTSIMTSAATPSAGATYATRAIANFSQQLGDSTATKGTRIDTYA